MATKAVARAEARRIREKNPHLTVNVRQTTKGNWGIRFSPKGKRDTWVPGSHIDQFTGRVVKPTKKRKR